MEKEGEINQEDDYFQAFNKYALQDLAAKVDAEIINAVVDEQLKIDKLLFGNAYYTIDQKGIKTRIDPQVLVIETLRKPALWQRIKNFIWVSAK